MLNEFIYSVFGALLSEELFIAIHYFSGKLDKFIPLQKGAAFQNVINKMKATAWDLYLLRLPAIFLCYDEPPFSYTAICTGDKSLQYIGRKLRIRRLYSTKGMPFPELEMDFSDISVSSSESESPILKLFAEFSEKRETRRRHLDVEEVLSNIDEAISNLEADVREFCRTGI